MEKTITIIILFLFFFQFEKSLLSQTATPPAQGNGTSGNPYQISTLNNLYWLSISDTAWNDYFIQTANIDASETNAWNAGAGFSPIGVNGSAFGGTYNGNGHTISGLFINRPSNNTIGLFGHTISAKIDSLALTNVNITGGSLTAAFIARADSGTIIESCFSSGYLSNNTQVIGGITGLLENGLIRNCYADCTINNFDQFGGGIAGLVRNSSIVEFCYSTSKVSGNSIFGGLLGFATAETKIDSSFFNSDSTNSNIIGIGLTTLEMKDMCSYVNKSWDFLNETCNGLTDIWGINTNENGGFPFLSWQGISHTEECSNYNDETAPVITSVHEDKVMNADTNCEAFLPDYSGDIMAIDNCDTNLVFSQNPAPETKISGATNVVTLTVEDNSGNTTKVAFNVLIEDNIKPLLSCIDNQSVNSNSSQLYMVNGSEFDPTFFSDNCGIESISNDLNNSTSLAGAQIPEGITEVNWTITDNAGNISTCSFNIEVNAYVEINEQITKSIKVYPNPTKGILNIRDHKNNIRKIEIIDIIGKLIFEKTDIQTLETIDISKQKSNIFIIRIYTSDKVIISKIIKK